MFFSQFSRLTFKNISTPYNPPGYCIGLHRPVCWSNLSRCFSRVFSLVSFSFLTSETWYVIFDQNWITLCPWFSIVSSSIMYNWSANTSLFLNVASGYIFCQRTQCTIVISLGCRSSCSPVHDTRRTSSTKKTYVWRHRRREVFRILGEKDPARPGNLKNPGKRHRFQP